MIREFDKTNEILYQSAWKSQFFSGMMMPIMQFVGNLGYVAVAIVGGYFTIKNKIEVGDIQSFIQYVRNFTQPITQAAQVANMLQSLSLIHISSASGLDPHISPEAAEVQVQTVAKNSGLSEEEVQQIVEDNTEHKVLGIFGEERVNVLKCNLAVANAMGILK